MSDPSVPWVVIWEARVSEDRVLTLIRALEREVGWHEDGNYDGDLAFCVDIVRRIELGQLVESPSDHVTQLARSALERATQLYPAVATYEPDPKGPPGVDDILLEINEAFEEAEAAVGEEDE